MCYVWLLATLSVCLPVSLSVGGIFCLHNKMTIIVIMLVIFFIIIVIVVLLLLFTIVIVVNIVVSVILG